MTVLIVGGTIEEASAYNETIEKKGEFVTNFDQLKDTSKMEIHFIGTYYTRGDLILLGQMMLVHWNFRKNHLLQSNIVSRFEGRNSLFQLHEFEKVLSHMEASETINIIPWPINEEQRSTLRFMRPKIFRRSCQVSVNKILKGIRQRCNIGEKSHA